MHEVYSRKKFNPAFSLLETLFALFAIGFVISVLYYSLTRINQFATANRLQTCAYAIVQDQIDRALNAHAFNPTAVPTPSIPPEFPCLTGTTAVGVTVTTSTAQAIYTDPAMVSGTALVANLPSNAMVSGTLSIAVTATTDRVTTGSGTNAVISTGTLQLVDVVLQYNYRPLGVWSGTNFVMGTAPQYRVEMSCLRASD